MTVQVVGAAIIRDGRVLAACRTEPPALAGLWELPGGKVEPGESDRAAVARECAEELRIDVQVGEQVGPELAIPPSAVLRVYRATTDDDPVLLEHSAVRWLTPDELDSVPWLPGDLPLLPYLADLLTA